MSKTKTRYFRLLTDCTLWFAGESVFSEKLKNRLLLELPKQERGNVEFEEITEVEAFRDGGYFLVSVNDFTGNYGEKNVFHDICGNEYHN